jgi:hypothetical protein
MAKNGEIPEKIEKKSWQGNGTEEEGQRPQRRRTEPDKSDQESGD